ncbi:MAG: A/G-specific adenine glycosylase [bacterium]|nr:A/G-specific adenine glycosylase [bacterium]
MELSKKEITLFRTTVRKQYQLNGRAFPWRETLNPYFVLVSEIMLQQTQTVRVEPKYRAFVKKYSTVKKLASANLIDVYGLWQGLGYNRRARMLRDAAKEIVATHKGKMPVSFAELKKLPGVGPYTAGAIMAFAYDVPIVIIETNIRAVFLHYFFANKEGIEDAQLLPLIAQTLPRSNAKKWYNALMDYGAYLKATHPNPSRKSKHHATQSSFEGSVRQARGAILRALLGNCASKKQLTQQTGYIGEKLDKAVSSLIKDGSIIQQGSRYTIRN